MASIRRTLFFGVVILTLVMAATQNIHADGSNDTLLLYANYSLPLTAAEESALQPYNEFHINGYTINKTVGQEQMHFKLPLDLTAGVPLDITLRLVSTVKDERHFMGIKGEATCLGSWVTIKCQFAFKDLNLDVSELENYALKKYGNSDKGRAIAKLAAQFGNDPIGVGQVVPFEDKASSSHRVNGTWTLEMSSFSTKTTSTYHADFDRNQVQLFNTDNYATWNMTYFDIGAFGTWIMNSKEGWLLLNISRGTLEGVWGMKGHRVPSGTIIGIKD